MKRRLTLDLATDPLSPSEMAPPIRYMMSKWNTSNPRSITLERQGGVAAKLWCAQLDQGEPFFLCHEDAELIMYWRKPVREEDLPLTRTGSDNSDSDFLYLQKLGMDEHSSEEEADAASVRDFFCYLEEDGYDGERQNIGLRMLEDGCAETMDWLARRWAWLGLPAIDRATLLRVASDLLMERLDDQADEIRRFVASDPLMKRLDDLVAEIRRHKAWIIQEK